MGFFTGFTVCGLYLCYGCVWLQSFDSETKQERSNRLINDCKATNVINCFYLLKFFNYFCGMKKFNLKGISEIPSEFEMH